MIDDGPLAAALGEYEAIRDSAGRVESRSTARFNFYIVVASALAVATANLYGSDGIDEEVRAFGSYAIAAITVAFGMMTFARLVHYTVLIFEYRFAANAIRTYLVDRFPELRPYVLLPTIGQPIPPWRGTRSGRLRYPRTRAGLASTTALINSVLLGAVGWFAAAHLAASEPTRWVAGGGALVGAFVVHSLYEAIVLNRSRKKIVDRAQRSSQAGTLAP